MNDQASLFEVAPVYGLPRPMIEFLAGFTTRVAFGDHPTAGQRREAAKVAEELGATIASLRARHRPQSEPLGQPIAGPEKASEGLERPAVRATPCECGQNPVLQGGYYVCVNPSCDGYSQVCS